MKTGDTLIACIVTAKLPDCVIAQHSRKTIRINRDWWRKHADSDGLQVLCYELTHFMVRKGH